MTEKYEKFKYLGKSNPNQNFYEKQSNPQFDKNDKENTVFAMINCKSMGLAMSDLSPAEFKVWCYLAKNQPGYLLAVSPQDALEWGGICKDTFQKAFRKLKEKGYLVPKEGKINQYDFYELPRREEELTYVEKKPLTPEDFQKYY